MKYLLLFIFAVVSGVSASAQTATKQLYLSNPGQALDRVHPGLVSPIDNTTATSTTLGQVINGLSIWHENNIQTPQYKVLNGLTNTYGSELTAPTVLSNKASVMMTAQSPTDASEAFLLEITSGKDIYLHQWNGTSWTAGAFNPLGGADPVKSVAQRSAAIAYSSNGNAMLVWDNDVADNLIHYRTWNGTTWAAAQTFTITTGANSKAVVQMQLAAHPTSGEMVLTFTDDGDGDNYAYVWNGTTWGNGLELTIDGSLTSYDVNVIYEHTSGHALVVYAKADDGIFYYRTWNGTAWSAESSKTFPAGATTNARVAATELAASPNSDVILLAFTTEAKEGIFMTWDGSVFSTTAANNRVVTLLEKTKNISPIDVAFESQSGQGLGVVQSSGATTATYFTWTSGTGYSTAASTPAFGDLPTIVELSADTYSDKIMLSTNANKIGATSLWNGTSWGTVATQEIDLGLSGDEGGGNGLPITYFWYPSATSAATTSFTQTPTLCSALTLPSGSAVSVTAYTTMITGSLTNGSTYDINAVLKYGATTIVTLNPATFSSASGGTLTWTGTMPSTVTVPSGQAITLDITILTYPPGVQFAILYDSDTKPSKVEFATSTFIDITSYAVYSAPYPGGSIITGAAAGTTVYPRAVVSDPFGFADITAMNITITPPGTTVAATSVATAGCTRTYEYAWNTTALGGTYSIPATAKEGFENVVTDVQALSFDVCSPLIGTPVFGLGTTSTRCQGAGSVTYTATSTNSTGISYSLDAASLTGGNTIVAGTGAVTYVAGWSGTSIITASATGCGGPVTAIHTVTITPSVGTPVFTLGATSNRCLAAGSVTYTATATNTTGITYSLDATSLAGGNTIVAGTGAVTYAANWAGTSIITASAAGCNGPATNTHTVTITAVDAINDAFTGLQGEPLIMNVVTNDLCNVNSASLTIVTQPQSGNLQIGVGGSITYLPNGNFSGTDQFTYRVCSTVLPAVCDDAVVTMTITPNLNDPCTEANTAKTYYLPFPENATQVRKALRSAGNTTAHTNFVQAVTSFKMPYPGTIITYDHWEDGYEANITVPIQSTTRVWGDGNLTNGIAPGYPTDVIPSGGYIILDNQFSYNPRTITEIVFDGKDKVYTTNDVSISKYVGDQQEINIQSFKTNVVDITRFGKLFVAPFGENVTLGSTSAFKYAGIFVRAATNGTIVSLDYNADNVVDVTQTLNEGEVWLYDGTASTPGVSPGNTNNANDIKAGATITSNFDVGVDMVFGDIASYGTRNFPLLPGAFYGDSYYCPVYTSVPSGSGTVPVYVFFNNTLTTPITVNWTSSGSSGNVVVPAKGTNFLNLPAGVVSGYKFESAGGESFSAIAIIDADATGLAYDWAFNLIPTERLTNFTSIAWAPGSANLTQNYNPIWVTAAAATTLYIKYDGDLSTVTPTMSPCNIPYDIAVPLTALQAYQIRDFVDNDQTGIALYTCNGATFSAAWGQDAFTGGVLIPSGGAAVSQDIGYTLTPRCLESLIIANDNKEITQPSTPVIVDILTNDVGFLCTVNPTSVSTTGLLQPSNGTTVINANGTITYTPNAGFTGTDMFEYRVCSIEYPGICDVALVTIMVGDCMALATENLITGKVYIEQLPDDGAYTVGEAFAGGVQVDLYIDANCNGVIDVATDNVMQSTVANLSGYYSFSTKNGYNAKDDFDATAAFTGNDGGINWTTNWVEQGDNNVINTGDVQIIADASTGGFGNAIRIGGPNNGISRSLTFNGPATSATLKFMYRRDNLGNLGEQLLVQVNGATVYTIDDGGVVGTDENYTEVTINLATFNASGSNTVQFITNGTPATTAFYWVDFVELTFFKTPSCFISKVNPSNTGGDFSSASLNNQAATFSGLGLCDQNNFIGVLSNLTAVDDAVNTPIDVPVIISVLGNDLPGTPNPSSVTTTGVTNFAANGTVVINPDGTITYTPNPGFTGTDDFEYKVCSLNDPMVCDIALVTVTVSCTSTPLQNTITGIVYDDTNLNATQQAGEAGHAAVGVNLYRDTDADGILDIGEPLVATETTSALGTYQFDITPPTTTNTYLDQFTVNTTANQTAGTTSWASASWTEVVEADGFAAGDITITSANGLRIQNANNGARRSASLTGAISATLIVNYNETGLDLDVDDYVDIQVATTATPGSWTLLKRHTGADGNQTGIDTFDISAYISATTTIRFISSTAATMVAGDIVNFDNVRITYSLPTAASYIVQLAQPIPTGYALTTPNPSPTGIQTASFTGAGAGDCQNNFALAGADLAITKVGTPDPVASGSNITYTITVTNNGPTNAAAVSVADALPVSLSLVSATPSVGSWTAPNWTVGTLANGASANIVIVATVIASTPAATQIINTATVTSTTTDPVSTNNMSKDTATVICPTLTVTPSSNSPVCQNGNLNLTESGGSAVGWSWTGSNGFTSTAQNPTISGVTLAAAGTYSVTITSISGCTASASTTVVINALPTVSIVETDASCTPNDGKVLSGGAATLTATAGFASYSWDNALGTGNPKTVNPLATTTYSVTATDANGCTATASSTVTINAAPSVSIVETDASCTPNDGKVLSGGAAILTATAGFASYSWDNTLGAGNPKTVNPLATTTYSVTATDANGCTATASSTVTIVLLPDFTLAQAAVCPGATDYAIISNLTNAVPATAQVKVNAGIYFAYPTPSNITPTEGLVSGNNTISVKNTDGCETAKIINIILTPANGCTPLVIEKISN